MLGFFIVVSVAVTSFTVWCGCTHQPPGTCMLNLASTLLSFELIRVYSKKRSAS